MIWIIIGIALAIWWIVKGWTDAWFFETIVGHVLGDIGKLLVGFAAGCIVLLISSGIIYASTFDYTTAESEQAIYALSDNTEASGSFFLGSGYVGSDLSYFYVIETDKGKHVESVTREHAFVNYGETPSVEQIEYDFSERAMYAIGVPMKHADYVFTVPEGTITNSFQIDLR